MKGKKGKNVNFYRLIPIWIRFMLFLALFLTLIYISGALVLPRLGINIELPFTRHAAVSESESILKELRPLFLLNTVEYTYKSVFPYDFIPPNADLQQAYRRVQQGAEVTNMEKDAAELYRLCLDSGIRIGSYDYRFVVITTRVKGGYQLEGGPWAASSNPETAADSGVHSNRSTGAVSLSLPEPVITDFIIRDETSSDYSYPDIELDAERWKHISDYVEMKIRSRVIQEGILEKTEENMKHMIRSILKESGWEYISFES